MRGSKNRRHHDRAEFDAQAVGAFFAELDQHHAPGAVVGVAIGGETVYRRGFGLANAELSQPLAPDIRMRIGSTSKHFTALAWLLLSDQGLASLDDPISVHLPELGAKVAGVSVRHLLSHTSGLRDVYDVLWQFNGVGHRVSAEAAFDYYHRIEGVNATPGETWCYNNGGYLLVSLAIERITGAPLEQAFERLIFAPAGMASTLLRRWDHDFLPHSATLHTRMLSGGWEKTCLGSASTGDGGVVSTVDDMLVWLSHLRKQSFAAPRHWTALLTPHVLNNGAATGYGLGLIERCYRGERIIYHGGGVLGGNSQMLTAPDAGLDLVIMLNRSDISAASLAYRVLDVCVDGLEPLNAPPKSAPVSGDFASSETGRVISLRGDGARLAAVIDGLEWPFEHEGGGVYAHAQQNRHIKQTITLIEEGETRRLELCEFAECFWFDECAAPERMRPLLGRYEAAALGVSLAFQGETVTAQGPFGHACYQLRQVSDSVWRAGPLQQSFPPGGIFQRSPDGACVTFTSQRTRGLRFERAS